MQETDAFSMVWNIPAGAKPVTQPHDAMLEHPDHAESPNGGNTGYRVAVSMSIANDSMFRGMAGENHSSPV